jgi:hypothetical protein
MKKQNLHILKFHNPLFGVYAHIVMLMALFFVISSNAFAQKINIYGLTPEWNNKTFCDNGNGYQPTIITAPSLSYSGAYSDKFIYNYQWEQAIDNGNWKPVLEVKDAKFIQAYTPSLLVSNNDAASATKYAWRLKITDIANDAQQVFSDVYSLTLYNSIKVTPQIISASADAKLFDINLSITGGSPSKTYKWVNADNYNEILNTQNAKNLNAGNYLVTIYAEGCLPVNINISTNKLNKTNN